MRSVRAIALNAFRESIRDRILYNLVLFAIALILFSLLLGEWSVFARENVIKDFTLAVMSIIGLLMAIFIGIGLVQKEIQRKTVLTLLAKPLPRWHFIVGKYLGLLLVLAVNLFIMTVAFYLVLWMTQSNPAWVLLKAVYLIYLEMALIVAVALLFSTFSTPTLSAVLTFGVYLAGHLSGELMQHIRFMQEYGSKLPGAVPLPDWFVTLCKVIYYAIPNLDNFNIKARVVYDLPVTNAYMLYTTLYGLGFIALFLLISSYWFGRRDFL